MRSECGEVIRLAHNDFPGLLRRCAKRGDPAAPVESRRGGGQVGEGTQVVGEVGVAATLADQGAPYCLVNNASVFPRGEVVELSLAAWELTLKVNITAPFLLCKLFGPRMIAEKRGVVINLASGRAVEGAAKGANYAATKAAVLSLTKSLALEWAKHGVRVNAIIPGQSLTAMPLENSTAEEMHAHAKVRNPMGRVGYPDDVAGLAAYLVSADAAYMTGQGVAINGGAVMIP